MPLGNIERENKIVVSIYVISFSVFGYAFFSGWTHAQGFNEWYHSFPYGLAFGALWPIQKGIKKPEVTITLNMIIVYLLLFVVFIVSYFLGRSYAPTEALSLATVNYIYSLTVPCTVVGWIFFIKLLQAREVTPAG